MKIFVAFILFLFVILIKEVIPANILFFHHVSTYSHRVQTWPLAEALSLRGHKVTYISPFQPKQPNPNITEIVPSKLSKYVDTALGSAFDLKVRTRREPLIKVCFDFGTQASENLFASPEFQEWYSSDPQIDLVVVDSSLPEAGVGLVHKLSAKSIIFSTIQVFASDFDLYGYLPESSAIPELEIDAPKVPLSFMERVSNTLMSIRWTFAHYMYSWSMDGILSSYLGDDIPPIRELMRNVSLIFYTGDFVSDYPRSIPPMYVNVAGIHCKPPANQALPKEIQTFLDSSKNDGFIYISMGSLAVPSSFPKKIMEAMFASVRSYPKIKFLWRWHGPQPESVPGNLLLQPWFPQQELLAHPNILGFITQGGRPSTLEAIYHGVPMITMPIQGDQDLNANRVSDMGGNILLEITRLTFKQMKDAVEKLAYDPSVKERALELQQIFRDRPMSPLDTAVWWTEYVLRMKDTAHLRPPGREQYWFQRRLIDVWAFLFVVSILTVRVGYWALKKLLVKRNVNTPKEKLKTT